MAKSDQEKRICLMRCTGKALYPVSQQDEEILMELSRTKDVEITFKYRRIPEKLRLYWWFLGYVNEATDAYPNTVKLHDAIKRHLGYVTVERKLNGDEVEVVDSIAMSAMDEHEFGEFFKRAERLIAEHFGIILPEKPATMRRAA